jgi:hypothetical protein
LKKLVELSSQFAASADRRIKFQKRRQPFIDAHDETLSFAVRVNDPNCAPIIVDG